MVKLVFLSDKFREDYPKSIYSEIELKEFRPYIRVLIKIDNDITIALPLRSHIKHNYAFWTNKSSRCGVDYSKGVVIKSEAYLEKGTFPRIRDEEFAVLKDKNIEERLIKGYKKYLKEYIYAIKHPNNEKRKKLINYSTAKYFHAELGITLSNKQEIKQKPKLTFPRPASDRSNERGGR